MYHEVEKDWQQLLQKLAPQLKGEPDIEALLFLIGIQESGFTRRKFTKDEKMDLMHVAICRLLMPYGYYQYEGRDADGWPCFKRKHQLPPLRPDEQEVLMKRAIIEYFQDN